MGWLARMRASPVESAVRALLTSLLCLLVQDAAAQMLPAASAELGPAPVMQPGQATQLPAGGAATLALAAPISVSPSNRYQVSLVYRNTYVAEDAASNNWIGSVSPCNGGTTAQAYQDALFERINVFRALAGLPGNISAFAAATDQADDQAAALMMVANHQLNHAPPNTWVCWTQAGYDGASHSNLTLGGGFNYNGATAIEGYMDDSGSGNTAVGHRRWILYPPQQNMATGDVDATVATGYYSANALWVFGPYGARPSTPSGIPWPPRGHVPWQLLPAGSNRWSLSLQNADFSNASVSMTRNGVALGAPTLDALQFNGQPSGSYIGDNTLVWEPQGVTYTQPAGGDVVYHVAITGIAGTGVPASVSYTVTVIDPYDAIFSDRFGD